MALPNIELYEALKRDLNEDAARMIAEVVPSGGDIATKADTAALGSDIARLEQRFDVLEANLKGYIDSRLLRLTLAFFVPMWISMAGLVGVLIART